MLKLSCFVLVLVLVACESTTHQLAGPTTDAPLLSDISTTRPTDTGTVHNDAMALMHARNSLPLSMGYDEYVLQIQRCFNKALAQYGPSRLITRDECAQVVFLLTTEVELFFDLTVQDGARMDPNVILDHWRLEGLIDDVEHAELVNLFREDGYVQTTTVAHVGKQVRSASRAYWGDEPVLDKKDCDDCGDPVARGIAASGCDTIGGIFGVITGGGPILSQIMAFAASTMFTLASSAGPGWTGASPPGCCGDNITGYGRGPVY